VGFDGTADDESTRAIADFVARAVINPSRRRPRALSGLGSSADRTRTVERSSSKTPSARRTAYANGGRTVSNGCLRVFYYYKAFGAFGDTIDAADASSEISTSPIRREVIVDCRDREADQGYGQRPTSIRHGPLGRCNSARYTGQRGRCSPPASKLPDQPGGKSFTVAANWYPSLG
jgi:hypothetical protein